MKRHCLAIPLMAVLVVWIGGSFAVAQQSSAISFEPEFAFKAGDNDVPAGSYKVSFRGGDRYLTLQDVKTGWKVMVPFLTRLSSREEPGVVFDKHESETYLTEIYFGHSDGFLFKGCPGEHQHVKIETQSNQ